MRGIFHKLLIEDKWWKQLAVKCKKLEQQKLQRISHALERAEDFLYSRNSEYIHETMMGDTPRRNDIWDMKVSSSVSSGLKCDKGKILEATIWKDKKEKNNTGLISFNVKLVTGKSTLTNIKTSEKFESNTSLSQYCSQTQASEYSE